MDSKGAELRLGGGTEIEYVRRSQFNFSRMQDRDEGRRLAMKTIAY